MKGAALKRLANADWLAAAAPFFECLSGDAGRTRAVGGVVRDTLLGRERPINDIDIATELTPEEVMERAQAAGLGAHPTGIEHGTVTLVSGAAKAEVTTLREDVETDGRHAKVVFGTDWHADAARRDFTMNALYADADGTLFDPLEGLKDCLAGHVRFIGDADTRIAEDRLRVYRYFRFVASHGRQRTDSEALEACARASGDLGQLSAERVGAEMVRLLDLARITVTLKTMEAVGVLDRKLFGVDILAALERYEMMAATPSSAARMGLMLCLKNQPTALQAAWRLSGATIGHARDLCAAAALVDAQAYNALAYYYPALKNDAAEIAGALMGHSRGWVAQAKTSLAPLSAPPFPLSGDDLIEGGFVPGPELGAELKRLETLWIESGFALDGQALLARARLPD